MQPPERDAEEVLSSFATPHRQFCDTSSLYDQEANKILNKISLFFYHAPFPAYKVKKSAFFLGIFWLTPAASPIQLQPATGLEIPGLIKTIFYVLMQALFALPGEKWLLPQSAIEVSDCCAEQNDGHFLLIKAQLGHCCLVSPRAVPKVCLQPSRTSKGT